MSQPPTPEPGRWAGIRERATAGLRAGKPLGPRLWLAIGLGAVLVIALSVWANAMVTPAHRVGQPTVSVAPLPASTSATPTPSAAETPTESASPEPSGKGPKLKASGKFDAASVSQPPVSDSGELRSYAVRVETSAKLSANKVGKQVAGVLNDPRSWAGSGGIRFALVAEPDKADFTITIAAPGTAAKLCKANPAGTCTDGSDAVIDATQWKSTPEAYDGSQPDWQAFLVNHAVGQLLGEKPAGCPKKAKPAPVMMPQAGDLDGCTANPWPYP